MTDTRNWRLGTRYRIHGYAETADSFDDEPIFTALNPVIAEQIIEDHKGVLAVRRDAQNLTNHLKRVEAENLYLSERLQEANAQIAKLQGHALRTAGVARRAYHVLGEMLDERSTSTPDATNLEAACE